MSVTNAQSNISHDKSQKSKQKNNDKSCKSDEEASKLKTTLHDSLSYSEEEFDVDDNDEDSCACSGHHHDDDSEHTYHDNSHIELSTDEPNKHKRDVRNFNKSFTEKKIREIERSNTLLMNKILLNNVRKTRYPLVDTSPVIKSTSNTVNRKRRQQEIDRNNLVKLINIIIPYIIF